MYHDRIHIEVIVEKDIETGSQAGKEIRREIRELLKEQLAESANELLEGKGIDITNSFNKLGMSDRGKYEEYKDDLGKYLKELEHEFEVEVVLLNERG